MSSHPPARSYSASIPICPINQSVLRRPSMAIGRRSLLPGGSISATMRLQILRDEVRRFRKKYRAVAKPDRSITAGAQSRLALNRNTPALLHEKRSRSASRQRPPSSPSALLATWWRRAFPPAAGLPSCRQSRLRCGRRLGALGCACRPAAWGAALEPSHGLAGFRWGSSSPGQLQLHTLLQERLDDGPSLH
jgi:hypothetical protein